MKTTRYSTSRQKSCQQCSNAKAKCDRKATSCSRCTLRGLACTYSQASLSGGSRVSLEKTETIGSLGSVSGSLPLHGSTPEPNVAMSPTTLQTSSLAGESTACIQPAGATSLDGLVSPASTNLAGTSRSAHHQRRHQVTSHTTRGGGGGGSAAHALLDFSHVDLVCPINANDIQNRWLKPYMEVAVPGQTAKTLSPSITAFTYRILKSYAAIAVRGGGGGHRGSIPPFLHPVHVRHTLPNTPALSTCLSLIRSCENPLPGSEAVLAEVLQREMNKLYEQYGHNTCDDDDDDDDDSAQLLAAFQAYLVYTLVLYYRLGYSFLRQQAAMMHLQEIACACSARGLVWCSAEQDGAQGAQGGARRRPRWETWIVAETKRRTLYTMYLLDNMLTAKEGLPTFLGTELRGLPAPASKALWQASAREEWEKAYNLHLAEWYPEGGLCIDELWAAPADMDEAGLVERRRRVDQWLEGVDEFGTMMYAVTSCTHGG